MAATAQYIPKFDLQGHRGARGLLPENTIPAFIKALDYGVTTIELDLAVTKDGRVIVSHEPWMSAEICLQPDGSEIAKADEMNFNIYQLTYDEVEKFDCGSRGNSRFPEQEKRSAHKPLLSDVIIAVEDYIKNNSRYEVDYNIEIKSRKDGDNIYHPTPQEFSDKVYQLVDQYLPWERIVVQSFDLRVLKYWKTTYPHVRLAFLIENAKSPQKNLEELGFIPSVYSPYFKLLTKEQVDYLHTLSFSKPPTNGTVPSNTKVRVIPWTVNETEDMKKLKTMGVDGLITDYPNRAAEIGLGLKRNGTNQNGSNKK
ncbi:MAG: glycerophosphodiester phosphodiesterase [Cyclobacteriaceae bacterium]|nr:glycerophosphodiester phosphodiesterase [Cyclobacteriaceae bacterium]UYN88483.1 MAG: glycerophosphodiester phosphodiesterase [Cyclobacteriaceae bacterium]